MMDMQNLQNVHGANGAETAIDSRGVRSRRWMVLINRVGIYLVVILLLLIGGIVAPGKYFTVANIRSTVQAISILGMVSVGMAFVAYSSNFADMSAPMTIAFSGMISVAAIGFGFWPAVVCGILAGTVLGLVNGFMVGKFRAHPIIWTMAFNFVMSGIVRWIWSGSQIYPDVIAGDDSVAVATFYAISRSSFHGVPIMVIVMAFLFLAGSFILTGTKFGNQLKVVGSNYEVARLSGINVVKCVILVYVINAICASIAGIFLASMAKTGAYYTGDGYDFRSITSVLLGGMTLAGGRGHMVGVFGGVITIGILNNIMTLIGIPTFNQWLVQGLVFLFIVWLNTNSSRKLGRV
ncbi:MAG: ABC transporter permease [Treponema sp.]|jgi:ribose/xylose/arabinose/galactoside ABC-type transport system permease subunit|nr:ABC transporter permease [Treponema sp.]